MKPGSNMQLSKKSLAEELAGRLQEQFMSGKFEVGEKLPPNLFFRINRRFIVAFDAIREMIRYSGSRIKVVLHPPLAEGEEAFVSTDRVPDFRQWLNR